jgi:hypothetical protein
MVALPGQGRGRCVADVQTVPRRDARQPTVNRSLGVKPGKSDTSLQREPATSIFFTMSIWFAT